MNPSLQRDDLAKGTFSKYRTALHVEYDGTDFSGFQIQNNARTVQQMLEKAVTQVYGTSCRIFGCSRTDAGVHARKHVSHVDLPFCIPSEKIPLALNVHLPDDVVVIAAKEVPSDFHARFRCKGKKYIYRVSDQNRRPSIDRRFVAHIPKQLQIQWMQEAAKYMIGKYDFSAFCASEGLTKDTVRDVWDVAVCRNMATDYVEISVSGASFLYNMVRIMAGTLIYVGQGKIDALNISDIIQKKQRNLAGKTMPANGLMLENVYFEPEIFPD